jgi:signal transduction histidine kinase
MELLPLSWQWFLATVGLWLVSIVGIFLAYESWSAWPIILCALLTFVVVLYGAYCFGQLRDAARKMSGGNLTEKIENKFLLGCFGDFAGHLNTLGDVCVESARQQMKSERMKTELITNVSHDIKTPLTSIINYVDLLRRTDDEAERAEYLAILDNQSQRLKKLIEDLMEMSRASSGNVAVEITPTDVGEALHQALGEFADRLEQRGLTVMTKIPAEPVMAQCDGRHLWRVLSNCLSNVVKYAMPGTRVYVDLERKAGMAEISLKNISAQTLNISSDELMERFVRGDASRNTEGNGLGLNIAKSLMEVQGGKLDLVVDGDLFKVILTLNAE